MTITHDWEKIFAYVWNNELSKQELSNIGIDITDRKWRRLFGKSPNRANYFFCNKCKNRHTIVPLDPDKFLALDEFEYCEREYQISEQDLQLFSFKKLAFIQDLQKHAFDLSEPGPKKIGEFCWELGKLVDYYKVFFLHTTDKFELLQAVANMREELIAEGRPIIILGISQKWFDIETIHLMESFKWYIIFLDNYLYLDNNGFVRSKTPLQQFDKLKSFIEIAQAPERSETINETLEAYITLDDRYRLKHPKAGKPRPMKVLQLRYGQGMFIEEIAKSSHCSSRKISYILKWIPDPIKKAYEGGLIKPEMQSSQAVEQANKIDQDSKGKIFPHEKTQLPLGNGNRKVRTSTR